jgi:hypothetical protein
VSDLATTLRARLRDPRAVPILARHAIPVIGVFVLGWSVLETIAALFLDALSTLWLVGAMGAYFAAKELDYGETGIIAGLQFWAGVFGVFVVIAGILTFAIGVPAMFLLPLLDQADVHPLTLLTSGWLPRAFGLMVACQIPGLVQRVRHFEAAGVAPEKMGMDAETGFVLHRTVMLAVMATMLAVLGRFALPVLVIVAQTFGALTEIMRDEYVGYLMTERRGTPPAASPAGPPPRRRWRKRRKR